MAIHLAENNYGKARVRLLRVAKQEGRHDIRELTIGIRFEGDVEAEHTKGDNRKILHTETMKNRVYALARQHSLETTEAFGLQLIEHFLTYNPQVSRVIIEASENIWARLPHGGKPHAYAFTRAVGERRTALLSATREGTVVRAGIEDLVILKTTDSAFQDFKMDPFTTSQDDTDRIRSTVIRANWLYTDEDAEFGPLWHSARQMLLDAFAEHDSQSHPHTLYAMGEAVLNNFDNISEIHLSLPNKHFHLVDLAPLASHNPRSLSLPTP